MAKSKPQKPLPRAPTPTYTRKRPKLPGMAGTIQGDIERGTRELVELGKGATRRIIEGATKIKRSVKR